MTSRARSTAAIAAWMLVACGAPAPRAAAPKPPPSGLSGVVLDQAGAPVAHARVAAWVPGSHGAQASTSSDDHGRFAMDLAPGRYAVRAGDDPSAGPITVTIDPGRRQGGVTLTLPPVVFETNLGNFF